METRIPIPPIIEPDIRECGDKRDRMRVVGALIVCGMIRMYMGMDVVTGALCCLLLVCNM